MGHEDDAGRYRLVSRLGSGGMGTVWRAQDTLLERPVAVKEVAIPFGLPPQEAELVRRRYLREARAAARLRHENVVVVHDVVSEPQRVLIVMDLLDARDLAAVVREDGPLDPTAVAALGLAILAALVAAHDGGVLHRDVKPANVLVDADGRVVLTDFGIASVQGEESTTCTGQLVGSPAYLAPERLTGGDVGPASDLWSLGCTLFAAVEGRSPFARPEPFAVVAAVTIEPTPEPLRAGPLTPVLHGLLAKDQRERWTADRVRRALACVAAGRPVEEVDDWGSPAPGPAATAGGADADRVSRAVAVRRGAHADAMHHGADAAGVDHGQGAVAVHHGPVAVHHGAVAVHHGPDAVAERDRPPTTDRDPAADPSPGSAPPAGRASPAGRRRVPRRVLLPVALVLAVLVVGGALGALPLRGRLLSFLPGRDAGTGQAAEPTAPVPVRFAFPGTDGRYSVDVPASWRVRRESPTRYAFLADAPAGRASTLRLVVVRRPVPPGRTSLRMAQDLHSAMSPTPGYRNVVIRGYQTGGLFRGTLQEYAIDDATGGRHVKTFRSVHEGYSYEVTLEGPEADYATADAVFVAAVDSVALPA